MSQMQHDCLDCGHQSFDNEILKCCPDCSSSNITNCPDETWDNPREDEGEDKEGVPLFI